MSSTPTVNASGSQTATINTEHQLVDITSAGTYLLKVDTVNMADGDILALRMYTKINGGTLRVCYVEWFYDAQDTDDLIKSSIPIPTADECKFTLKQTAGTGRAFVWEVLAL